MTNKSKIFAVDDTVDYDCEGIGIVTGTVIQTYELPYVSIIDNATNERFYAPTDRVTHA